MVSEKAPSKPTKVDPVPEKDGKATEDPAAAAGSAKTGEMQPKQRQISIHRSLGLPTFPTNVMNPQSQHPPFTAFVIFSHSQPPPTRNSPRTTNSSKMSSTCWWSGYRTPTKTSTCPPSKRCAS